MRVFLVMQLWSWRGDSLGRRSVCSLRRAEVTGLCRGPWTWFRATPAGGCLSRYTRSWDCLRRTLGVPNAGPSAVQQLLSCSQLIPIVVIVLDCQMQKHLLPVCECHVCTSARVAACLLENTTVL